MVLEPAMGQNNSLRIATGCILRDTTTAFHFPAGIIICQVRIAEFGAGLTSISQDLFG